jgi:hypothetical protein
MKKFHLLFWSFYFLSNAYAQSLKGNLPDCDSSFIGPCYYSGPVTKNGAISKDYFEGRVQNKTWNGEGKYTFESGEVYTGNFIDGMPNGYGQHRLANGDFYQGGFRNAKRHGSGTQTYANNDKYVGDFINDLKHGNGTYFYASGSKHEGAYSNNQPNGKGIYYFSSGARYEGDMKDGKYHGKGKFFFPDGAYYVGEFKLNKFDGNGVLYGSNSTIINKGIFKDNKFVGESNSPNESVTKPRNSVEVGNANKCKRLGLIVGTEDYNLCLKAK